jgi:putative addiction module component (TIGR02574 family)
LEDLIMTQAAKNIVKAAARLGEKERVEVVEHLLASLDSQPDKDVDSAWVAEVERRSRQIKEGVVRAIPWSTVKSKARKRTSANK